MTKNSATVLVVDDEAPDRDFIRRALNSVNFDVLGADGYDSAAQLFDSRREDIDLLLTDVSLPGKTGIELARALLRSKPGLKVLFVSGHVGAEVIRFHGLPASDHHFLQKPFRADVLIARVRGLLNSADPLDWLEPKDRNGGTDATKRS
jgi:two-component system, cell cycle sensor histidine kinase and response regulator CckA